MYQKWHAQSALETINSLTNRKLAFVDIPFKTCTHACHLPPASTPSFYLLCPPQLSLSLTLLNPQCGLFNKLWPTKLLYSTIRTFFCIELLISDFAKEALEPPLHRRKKYI
ncbi:hypothetical protein ACTXT7_013601 [Hymenolepis weldensis]